MAFNEGRLGGGSFHTRMAFDFLDAALATDSTDAGLPADEQEVRHTKGVVVPTKAPMAAAKASGAAARAHGS